VVAWGDYLLDDDHFVLYLIDVSGQEIVPALPSVLAPLDDDTIKW
jgi:hypothetical protein